jgi:hypothetical protein
MLRSLPNFSRTRNTQEALQWLAANRHDRPSAPAMLNSPELES